MSQALRPTIPRTAAAVVLLVVVGCSDASKTAGPSARQLASKGGSPSSLPDRYILPGTTVFPEGVAYDELTGSVFVSSTTNGAVFRGDVKDETLSPFLPGGGDGRTTAIGLAVDDKGRLWVAGGATGFVFVYDGTTGELLARLSGGSSPTFINDIDVGPGDTAYVTDSQSPWIYRVFTNASGTYQLERWLNYTGTSLIHLPGFNVNGIEVTPDGRYLVVVQSNTGKLFRIEIATREVTEIDLGGAAVPGGDGILLRGSTLYVLQNAAGLLTEIRLNLTQATGTVVGRTTDPSFGFPTSLDFARGHLLVVNSQFNRRGPGLTPVLPFTVSVIKQP